MKRKFTKGLIIILGIIATMLVLTTVSNAASLRISTSKSSVAPGEVFTVTVTLDDGAGPISASASNGSGSASQWLENNSLTFNCTAGSSGTVTISASGTVGDFITEKDVPVSSTKSVSIVVPTPEPPPAPPTNTGTSSGSTNSSSNSSSSSSSSSKKPSTSTTTTTVKKSSNSKLSSLQIAEGAISPEFSSSVKEYEINVPNEITKLNITAEADSSKAKVKITGNEELQVGDNNIEIIVTAEDGSKTSYKILAKRAQEELSLQALTINYLDENGEQVELALNPAFAFNIYEYNIDTILPHTVKGLEILGTANRENAVIEIVGNEELKTGENVITVKVTVTDEAGLEEQKTYTIKVEKEEEPVVAPLSTIDKIKNWFNGVGSTISTWYTENYNKIIVSLLVIATVAYIGLTIYYIYDYKKYQQLMSKIAELNKINLMEKANIALNPENASNIEETNNIGNTYEHIVTNNISTEEKTKPEIKFNRGRRFK